MDITKVLTISTAHITEEAEQEYFGQYRYEDRIVSKYEEEI